MNNASPILVALLSSGCVIHVDGERPLSDDGKRYMDTILAEEPAVTAMVVALAERMEEGTLKENGAPGTAKDLALAVVNTVEWLRLLHDRGAIMEADPELFDTPDTVAQYDVERLADVDDDRIVVSTDRTTWNLETLVHEAGHRNFSHDLFVTRDIRESGAALNEGFADAIITHHDYAYLLTALYAIPASLVRENRTAIEESRMEHRMITMRSLEETEENLRRALANHESMFMQFGLSVNDVIDAYRESGMYDYCTAERSEARREVLRERLVEPVDSVYSRIR